MGTITYNAATNTITMVGYWLGIIQPWDVDAMYAADKATHFTLDSRTAISTVDGGWKNTYCN